MKIFALNTNRWIYEYKLARFKKMSKNKNISKIGQESNRFPIEKSISTWITERESKSNANTLKSTSVNTGWEKSAASIG